MLQPVTPQLQKDPFYGHKSVIHLVHAACGPLAVSFFRVCCFATGYSLQLVEP